MFDKAIAEGYTMVLDGEVIENYKASELAKYKIHIDKNKKIIYMERKGQRNII